MNIVLNIKRVNFGNNARHRQVGIVPSIIYDIFCPLGTSLLPHIQPCSHPSTYQCITLHTWQMRGLLPF
jgi:hypothetical protein